MTRSATILGLYRGRPEQLWQDRAPSAIRKTGIAGPVEITADGMSGDRQADLTVHGGPDKALHLYPAEHHAHWRATLEASADLFRPGAFGENIATRGLTEADLCIGDILAAGSVRLQVSQGRQPCWKLNLHTGLPTMAAAFQKTGRTGYYVRVLEAGHVQDGDTLEIVERPLPQWSLREVTLARFDPAPDPDMAARLAGLDLLASSWRTAFARKAGGAVEDTGPRLKG